MATSNTPKVTRWKTPLFDEGTIRREDPRITTPATKNGTERRAISIGTIRRTRAIGESQTERLDIVPATAGRSPTRNPSVTTHEYAG